MLTRTQLVQILSEVGIRDGVLPRHSEYDTPALGWNDRLAGPWDNILRDLGITYTIEAFDCKIFAYMCAAYAKVVHFKNRGRLDQRGVAIGEIGYLPPNVSDGHAVVIAVEGPTSADVRFYEPQRSAETQFGGDVRTLRRMPLPDFSQTLVGYCII